MAHILTVRHVPHEPLGTLEDAFNDAGLECRYVDLFKHVPARLPLDKAAGLVVLGGPMNVDETDRYPFLAPELDWLREAIAGGVPVMGVCLGAQLLSKALGGRVSPNGVKEIGWYTVDLAPAAADDPLFGGCESPLTVFQWHGDTYTLPAGAVHLARSAACAQQAFRYGPSAYGLQFHIEMTAEMIEDWLTESENSNELSTLPYINPAEIRRRTPDELPRLQSLARTVLGRYAAMCAKRG